ncbi:MAG TPA: WHG domain-containing protein, partial [Ktedonobacterales bacterium]|nr:WHG domain-containing protein [Ktedonobacterales bacterium]
MATRAGLDQAAVVREAATLADEVGLEGLTLATLAARLHVQTPTLYHYVDGLAGLRRELALLGVHEMAARLGTAIMGKAGDDAVLALAQSYRAFVKEHPGLYAATVRAAEPGNDVLAAAGQEVIDIVLRALAAYQLQGDDAIHTVRVLRSVLHGFATLENAGGFGIPLAVDETFRRLMETL